MQDITLSIREKHQFTGAHEHVVVFDAYIVLDSDDLTIEMELASLFPEDAELDLVEIALNRIRDGIRAVLTPRGYGAVVQVSHLMILPTDFQEKMFEVYTVKNLDKALNSTM